MFISLNRDVFLFLDPASLGTTLHRLHMGFQKGKELKIVFQNFIVSLNTLFTYHYRENLDPATLYDMFVSSTAGFQKENGEHRKLFSRVFFGGFWFILRICPTTKTTLIRKNWW